MSYPALDTQRSIYRVLYIIKDIIRAMRARRTGLCSNGHEKIYSTLDIELRLTNAGYVTFSC